LTPKKPRRGGTGKDNIGITPVGRKEKVLWDKWREQKRGRALYRITEERHRLNGFLKDKKRVGERGRTWAKN